MQRELSINLLRSFWLVDCNRCIFAPVYPSEGAIDAADGGIRCRNCLRPKRRGAFIPRHIKPLTCRFVVPATGVSAELKKLAEAAIAMKPVSITGTKIDTYSRQAPTRLGLSRILKLTAQEKDRAAFAKDLRFFKVGVNTLVEAKRAWALCSLLDHPNRDLPVIATGGLRKLADPDTVPVLLAAAKRNDYRLAMFEYTPFHLLYRQSLKSLRWKKSPACN